ASHTNATLSGASSHTAGAPGCEASTVAVTEGNGSYSTNTDIAASAAWEGGSATTSATGAPTWGTRPPASPRRGATNGGAPSSRLRPESLGSGPSPSAA